VVKQFARLLEFSVVSFHPSRHALWFGLKQAEKMLFARGFAAAILTIILPFLGFERFSSLEIFME
jgi:hypothetical protein